ncbi:hypothetical protein GALLN_00316 [Gallionellaceae bacterium]|nr:hypothetical protein GALLN_00316 [Gallionellaceae bacterium]
MKKIALYLAGLLAAVGFIPQASALPAFARQVGMACNACHAQHFPVLNSFGRAFKASGYTLMGAQAKVEGEGLSLPDTLNGALFIKVRHQKDNTAGAVGGGTTAPTSLGNGRWDFGDETSLFFGGRVAENVGFIFEGNLVNHTGGVASTQGAAGAMGVACTAAEIAAGSVTIGAGGTAQCLAPPNVANNAGGSGGFLAGIKLPFSYGVGTDGRVSVIPFTTDALGVQYGYELSSGGVMRANRWAELRRDTSAVQYNADQGADAGAATGIAFVAQNEMGFINLTKWSPSFMPGGNGQAISSTKFNNDYARIAFTPTVANWALMLGGGKMSGSSFSNVGAGQQVDTNQTFYDFQAQGQLAGKEIAIYAQHAKAPNTVVGNAYNASGVVGNPDRKATTIGVDYSVIPHALSIGASRRKAENGTAAGVNGDDAWTVTAVYDLYQNIGFHLNYSSYSGSSRNTPGAQKNLLLLMLEGAW